jgi:hypothetical protein
MIYFLITTKWRRSSSPPFPVRDVVQTGPLLQTVFDRLCGELVLHHPGHSLQFLGPCPCSGGSLGKVRSFASANVTQIEVVLCVHARGDVDVELQQFEELPL